MEAKAKALMTILAVHAYHKSTGAYPAETVNDDQAFDDWAADIAESALEQRVASWRTALAKAAAVVGSHFWRWAAAWSWRRTRSSARMREHKLEAALRLIRDARDHNADVGAYPADTLAPGQTFEEWAVGVARDALAHDRAPLSRPTLQASRAFQARNGARTNPALQIERRILFVLSTAHIQQKDSEQLLQCARTSSGFPPINGGLIADTGSGYLLWIGEPFEDDHQLLEEAHYSAHFSDLLRRVYREAGDSCYLMIDSDAEVVEGLPTFEW